MVGWGVVFVGSPGNIELAVGDDFVVISFLAHRGEGQKRRSSLEQSTAVQEELKQLYTSYVNTQNADKSTEGALEKNAYF